MWGDLKITDRRDASVLGIKASGWTDTVVWNPLKESMAAWSKCSLGAPPQLGSCASSGRICRLAQGEAGPPGAQPLLRVLEPAVSKVASFTAFDHLGMGSSKFVCVECAKAAQPVTVPPGAEWVAAMLVTPTISSD